MDKRIKLYESEQFDVTWPSENAAEFLAWLTELLAKVPAEFLPNAKIEIGSNPCYDSSTANIEIYYDRPETEEEAERRLAEERRHVQQIQARELQQLAALKRKYEGGT